MGSNSFDTFPLCLAKPVTSSDKVKKVVPKQEIEAFLFCPEPGMYLKQPLYFIPRSRYGLRTITLPRLHFMEI